MWVSLKDTSKTWGRPTWVSINVYDFQVYRRAVKTRFKHLLGGIPGLGLPIHNPQEVAYKTGVEWGMPALTGVDRALMSFALYQSVRIYRNTVAFEGWISFDPKSFRRLNSLPIK